MCLLHLYSYLLGNVIFEFGSSATVAIQQLRVHVYHKDVHGAVVPVQSGSAAE